MKRAPGSRLRAVAVLPDGRVVTCGGYSGRVLVWNPAEPDADPAELGPPEHGVGAVAVLPDGRVVTGGGYGGPVLVWSPAAPPPRSPRPRGGRA
jgi:WD40 repeat protein